MNEMLDSQLSAMFDDELPAQECELLARRLSRDELLRQRWRRYALISASLQGDASDTALRIDLSARVQRALADDAPSAEAPVAFTTPPRSRRWQTLWQGAAGFLLVIGVALFAVWSLQQQTSTVPVPKIAQQQVTVPPNLYTVPTVNETTPWAPNAELANYVVMHSEYSAPLSRRNLLSTLVESEAANIAATNSVATQGGNDAP
jgi:negative regulator of sigma E activity